MGYGRIVLVLGPRGVTISSLPTPVAQVVEFRFGEREVTGSIPGRDIPKWLKMVPVAPRLALRLTRFS